MHNVSNLPPLTLTNKIYSKTKRITSADNVMYEALPSLKYVS